ncbi:MAG: hypothetical protein ACK5LC_08275 [Coprobacillaceae bacterium]
MKRKNRLKLFIFPLLFSLSVSYLYAEVDNNETNSTETIVEENKSESEENILKSPSDELTIEKVVEDNEQESILHNDNKIPNEVITPLAMDEVFVNGINGDDNNDGSTSTPVKSITQALTLVNNNGTIIVVGSISINGDERWDASGKGDVRIRLNMNTSESYPWVLITEGNALTLKNITMDGTKYVPSRSHNGSAIHVKGGSLTMLDGSSITNYGTNQTVTDGGAVRVTHDGQFTMGNNTTIRNCSAQFGGAIYIGMIDQSGDTGGLFNMKSGAIIENCDAFTGGAVFLSGNKAVFQMDGGTIQNCELVLVDFNGGAINVTNGSSFIMNNGIIQNNINTMQERGAGAINVSSYYYKHTSYGETVPYEDYPSEFIMNGGSISNNSAAFGGALFVGTNYLPSGSNPDAITATFKMNGGTIDYNKATKDGGALFVMRNAETYINNGIIEENESDEYAGGIFLATNSYLKIINGSIQNNRTIGNGGAILNYGKLEISGGNIFNNSADTSGGGIHHQSGEVHLSGGLIKENTASKGDGVYVATDNFNISGNIVIETSNDVYLTSNNKINVVDIYTGATTQSPMYITSEESIIENDNTIGTELVVYNDKANGENGAFEAEFNQLFVPSKKMPSTLYIGQSKIKKRYFSIYTSA